jgi:DNA-binding CsgD family transcriptional regulator
VLVIAVGTIHGFYNGIAMAGGPGVSGLFGIASILFGLVAIASALVISLRVAWIRVAARVTGTWIVAVALLLQEHETLTYLITGMLNKQIAFDLNIAERTVKAHRKQVLKKMGVTSIAELVRLAEKAGVRPVF